MFSRVQVGDVVPKTIFCPAPYRRHMAPIRTNVVLR
jgi:hypothetical protein